MNDVKLLVLSAFIAFVLVAYLRKGVEWLNPAPPPDHVYVGPVPASPPPSRPATGQVIITETYQ